MIDQQGNIISTMAIQRTSIQTAYARMTLTIKRGNHREKAQATKVQKQAKFILHTKKMKTAELTERLKPLLLYCYWFLLVTR